MNLKELDLSQLSELDQMRLYSFHNAYSRAYPTMMSWRDCRNLGLEPKEYTHCGLTEIEESLDELDTLSTFHLNESGEVVAGVGDRADWQERLINKWSRKKEWSIH